MISSTLTADLHDAQQCTAGCTAVGSQPGRDAASMATEFSPEDLTEGALVNGVVGPVTYLPTQLAASFALTGE